MTRSTGWERLGNKVHRPSGIPASCPDRQGPGPAVKGKRWENVRSSRSSMTRIMTVMPSEYFHAGFTPLVSHIQAPNRAPIFREGGRSGVRLGETNGARWRGKIGVACSLVGKSHTCSMLTVSRRGSTRKFPSSICANLDKIRYEESLIWDRTQGLGVGQDSLRGVGRGVAVGIFDRTMESPLGMP